MNEIIKSIAECGLSETVRTMCIVGGAVAATVSMFWYGRKMGLGVRQLIITMLIAYPINFVLLELSFRLTAYVARNHLFGIDTVVNSAAKTFVLVPLLGILIARAVRVRWKMITDLLAFVHINNIAVCWLGCTFTGCCVGYPCSWGLYDPMTQQNTFPTQILNSLIMAIIALYLAGRAKKLCYIPDGRQYPIMLILFGIMKFATEFLMNNEKLAFGCSIVSFHSAFLCLVGIVVLTIINKREKTASKQKNCENSVLLP